MKAVAISLAGLLLAGAAQAKVEKNAWGETPEGRKVDIYTLTNAHGLEVRISNYGGTIIGLATPDRTGKMADIVRAFDSLQGYVDPTNDKYYYGAIIGRFANVIKDGRFTLEGRAVQLPINSNKNNLHGGPVGFNKRIWTAVAKDGASPSLTLTYTSPDGENGFPGTLKATVIYTLTADNALRMEYRATTDRPTVVNLTNHSYFNLKGHSEGDVLGHRLQILADNATLRDDTGAPDGRIIKVRGTGLDFTTPTPIGAHIASKEPQIAAGSGFNQNYIINGKPGVLRLGARVEEPATGRVMEMRTTQPGVQLFTTNFPDTITGKGGAKYARHGAFCLETQHYPNSPNVPSFPSTELKPGREYREVTEFHFSVRK